MTNPLLKLRSHHEGKLIP